MSDIGLWLYFSLRLNKQKQVVELTLICSCMTAVLRFYSCELHDGLGVFIALGDFPA